MKRQRVVSVRLTEEESALWDSWKRDGATDADVFRWLAANWSNAHGVPAPAGSGGGTLVANIVRAIRKEVLPILQYEIRAVLVNMPMQVAPPAPTPFSAGAGGFVAQQRVMNEQAAVLFNRQDDEEELWDGAQYDDVE